MLNAIKLPSRRSGLAVACFAIVGSAGVSGIDARAADARLRCGLEGTRLVASAKSVRVVEKRASGEVFACRVGRRRVYLGQRTPASDSSGSFLDVRNVRVSGRYVAWEDEQGRESDIVTSIVVVDLRARRRVRTVPTLTSERPSETADIVLKSNGSVGWIAKDVFVSRTRREVHRADKSGPAELAAGDAIGSELSLKMGVMSWLSEGEQQSAPLK